MKTVLEQIKKDIEEAGMDEGQAYYYWHEYGLKRFKYEHGMDESNSGAESPRICADVYKLGVL